MIAEYERAKMPERRRRDALGVGQRASGKLPFGDRRVTENEGGGVARVEVMAEDARLGSA